MRRRNGRDRRTRASTSNFVWQFYFSGIGVPVDVESSGRRRRCRSSWQSWNPERRDRRSARSAAIAAAGRDQRHLAADVGVPLADGCPPVERRRLSAAGLLRDRGQLAASTISRRCPAVRSTRNAGSAARNRTARDTSVGEAEPHHGNHVGRATRIGPDLTLAASSSSQSRSGPPRTLVRMSELRPRLRELFGFSDFRPGQEEVVRAAVDGRDTLALMPTGSGKSLTYQLAAMLRPEPTLVLSPLIALMKDQVDQLPAEIAATATFVNSSLEPSETARRLDDVASGSTRLLYAAPERLRSRAFVQTLRSIGVGLVVIDEVHCVSMWGHDFRPDYLFIRRVLEALEGPGGARDDGDRDARHRDRDRRGTRSRARGRANERRSPEPPLRRRGGRRQRGPASDPRRAASRPRRGQRHRLRPLPGLLRAGRADAARTRDRDGALSRRTRAG